MRLVLRLFVAAAVLVGLFVVFWSVWLRFRVRTEENLAYSVARKAGSAFPDAAKCTKDSDVWTCTMSEPAGSGSMTYRVAPVGDDCWRAQLLYNHGEPAPVPPRRVKDCIGFRDVIRYEIWR